VHDDAPNVDATQPTPVDVNAVILTGYLVAEPEVRPTRDNGDVTVVRLAIPRSGAIDYIDVLFPVGSGRAEAARQLSKGQRVLVTGQLREQRWKTKKGTSRCKHAIAGSTLDTLPFPAALDDPPHPPPTN
jgi:single-stranded DNA-binding protein